MTNYKVSVGYASSLLDSSIEKNNLEETTNDMEFVLKTFQDNPELRSAISSPVIKTKFKTAILDDIFKSRISVDSLNFLQFVVSKGRESLVSEILLRFLELNDEHLGIAKVELRSALELSPDQTKILKENFEDLLKKKIKFIFKLDPEMIGGFTAKVGDTVYDASIRHQLGILKKQFKQGGASLN
jgi:F-type H+-transporting ATPase subunit delta